MGATFDPSALYRFNAIQRMLKENGITTKRVAATMAGLQAQMVEAIANTALGEAELLNPLDGRPHARFLAFRDPRAQKIGDVITVNIQINDKASLDNTTDRSRNAKIGAGFDLAFAWGGYSKEGSAAGSLRSESAAKGQGTIDRSEKIQFSVGAVVTGVLPNGNLVISGSQEVRVNFEMRVLNVAGIVRPVDISADNSIAYEKIAEARIAYGGRGRLMEVQQPPWGQQLVDNVSPF